MRSISERGQALRGRADAHAVDQQQRVARLQAADEQLAGVARPAGARAFQARLARQQLRQREAAGLVDVGAGEHGDVGHGVGQRFGHAQRGHGDLLRCGVDRRLCR